MCDMFTHMLMHNTPADGPDIYTRNTLTSRWDQLILIEIIEY